MGAEAWAELVETLREITTLENVRAVISWDQQTNMPEQAAKGRSDQTALLSRLVHERFTAPRIGELIHAVEENPKDEVQAAAARNLRRTYARSTQLSSELVGRISKANSDGFQAWLIAKQSGNFETFAPALQQILDLTLESTNAIDASAHPYDLLIDQYDPGTTQDTLQPMFARLRAELGELISAIRDTEPMPKLTGHYDLELQKTLHQRVIRKLGFDTTAGRLDFSEHPFTIDVGPGDIRITTHLYPTDLLGGLSGTIHETGHGMYEQGLPRDLYGTSVEKAASFGLHESQSRFWENFIGGSMPFLQWLESEMHGLLPDPPKSTAMYRAANRVCPGLIRIFADEVTYNLHIIIRFELELALFEGRLAVKDLPDAWNAAYRDVLGVEPTNNSEGVLQDVHWSSGAFGYFPSYTLGNLYAASIGEAITEAIPNLWIQVADGEFGDILQWLRRNIHQPGHRKDAPDLIRDAIGERDAVDDLMNHLWNRHGALHGVRRP